MRMHRTIRGIMVLCLLAAAPSVFGQMTQEQVFQAKRSGYLSSDGENLLMYHERVWGWLEKIRNGTITASTPVKDVGGVYRPVGEVISKIIRCWGNPWSSGGYPTYGYAWYFGEWYANLALIYMYLEYNSVLTSADRLFIQNTYNSTITSRDFSPGSENSRMFDMVGRYLWAQYYPSANVTWSYNPPPTTNIYAFSWGGRTYTPGGTYPAHQLATDYIYYFMDRWVSSGNAEFDSPHYSWCLIYAYWALYDFALDETMKKKARMMLDFMFLESGMDYSANHWGGALGRAYGVTIAGGRTRMYWDFFFEGAVATGYEPSYSVLASDYRLPDVIWDAIDLNDEPDNYYHINMENNGSIVYCQGTGKWNYVTKFYNLGGRVGTGWQLCIKSTDTPGSFNHPGTPFIAWINTYDSGGGSSTPAQGETYITQGEYGFQYRNALFSWGYKWHEAIAPNSWDLNQKEGSWQFFMEGRTMVAVIRDSVNKVSGLEVGIQGVDYATWDDFKREIRNKAALAVWSFTTSKGNKISTKVLPGKTDWDAVVTRPGDTDYSYVWPYPFQRIQAVDYRNQVIVRWEGQKMIVKRHGRQRTYDFGVWTYTDTAAGDDIVPPAAPTGVNVR
jgi:hypothetical protein